MMASDFPTSLDDFPEPLANSPLNAPSHSGLHQDVNDAVEKIEVKLGVGASPASGAFDGQVLKADGAGTSEWSDIVVGDIDATGQAVNDVIVADGAGNAAWSGAAGLWLVKTQTIGTGVSTIVVDDAFSSTYDNYIIQVNGGTSSATTFISLRLGSAVSSYRWQFVYGNWASSALADGAISSDRFFYVGSANIDGLNMSCTVLSPNLAKGTRIIAEATVSGSFSGNTTGLLVTVAQYTSFTLLAGSGTFTGGTIRVYGYKK